MTFRQNAFVHIRFPQTVCGVDNAPHTLTAQEGLR